MLSAQTNERSNHHFSIHRKPNRERNGTMNELDHFRDEVQTFLAEHLTAELQRAGRLEAGIYAERPVAEAWLKYSIRRAGRSLLAYRVGRDRLVSGTTRHLATGTDPRLGAFYSA